MYLGSFYVILVDFNKLEDQKMQKAQDNQWDLSYTLVEQKRVGTSWFSNY
jgi:hypothetical protein